MTFHRERYPSDWPVIRATIRARSGDLCECTGQCGDEHDFGGCHAPNHTLIDRPPEAPREWTLHEHDGVCVGEGCPATLVILTVAHLDHDESNNDPSNLAALCQRCHLLHDRRDNARRARDNRDLRTGQGRLPL